MVIDTAAVIAALSLLVNLFLGFMALRAPADKAMSEAATSLVKPLTDRVRDLEAQLGARRASDADLRKQLADAERGRRAAQAERDKWQARAETYARQLRGLGVTPVDFGDKESRRDG